MAAVAAAAGHAFALLRVCLTVTPCACSQSGVFASWRVAASPAAADAFSTLRFVAAEQHQIQAAILQINASSKPSKGMGSVPGLAPASLGAGRGWPANHAARSLGLCCPVPCCAVLW